MCSRDLGVHKHPLHPLATPMPESHQEIFGKFAQTDFRMPLLPQTSSPQFLLLKTASTAEVPSASAPPGAQNWTKRHLA